MMTQTNDFSQRMSPSRAIRLKCLDCCSNSQAAVKACPVTGCALWNFRLGYPYGQRNKGNPLLDPVNFKGKELWEQGRMNKYLCELLNDWKLSRSRSR